MYARTILIIDDKNYHTMSTNRITKMHLGRGSNVRSGLIKTWCVKRASKRNNIIIYFFIVILCGELSVLQKFITKTTTHSEVFSV